MVGSTCAQVVGPRRSSEVRERGRIEIGSADPPRPLRCYRATRGSRNPDCRPPDHEPGHESLENTGPQKLRQPDKGSTAGGIKEMCPVKREGSAEDRSQERPKPPYPSDDEGRHEKLRRRIQAHARTHTPEIEAAHKHRHS